MLVNEDKHTSDVPSGRRYALWSQNVGLWYRPLESDMSMSGRQKRRERERETESCGCSPVSTARRVPDLVQTAPPPFSSLPTSGLGRCGIFFHFWDT